MPSGLTTLAIGEGVAVARLGGVGDDFIDMRTHRPPDGEKKPMAGYSSFEIRKTER